MATSKVYERTLEEITERYGSQLRGRHLRVLVDDDSSSDSQNHSPSESALQGVGAFSKCVSGQDSNRVSLPDEAMSRDVFYEGRS